MEIPERVTRIYLEAKAEVVRNYEAAKDAKKSPAITLLLDVSDPLGLYVAEGIFGEQQVRATLKDSGNDPKEEALFATVKDLDQLPPSIWIAHQSLRLYAERELSRGKCVTIVVSSGAIHAFGYPEGS